MKKRIVWLLLAMFLTGLSSPLFTEIGVSAPYESYNYDYWKNDVKSPAPYLPKGEVTGRSLGIGDFKEPQDMCVDAEGRLYVADTGNNRIIVLDRGGKLLNVLTGFDHNGAKDSFNSPGGVFVTPEGGLYVADTGNGRVVVLDEKGQLETIIQKPASDVLPPGFVFAPLKVGADEAKRIYVVAKGVFEGIMQFDDQGEFIGYIGTNRVRPDAGDYFWKMISTKAQRDKMVLFVPTEFTNLDLDSRGFVYATNVDPYSDEPIKRLNPSGADTLKRFGYFPVKGDVRYDLSGSLKGPSYFVDIKVTGSGMYSALDSRRGRVFTYDQEGNLLHVFGQLGAQAGTFKAPAAIEAFRERLFVLDRMGGRVHTFEATDYGRAVNQATALQYEGKDREAAEIWKEVLRLNANYDAAYIGIGKALLREGKNKEALEYFELGMNRKYYGIAYKRYRKEWIREYFGVALTALTLLSAAAVAYRFIRKWRKERGAQSEARFS